MLQGSLSSKKGQAAPLSSCSYGKAVNQGGLTGTLKPQREEQGGGAANCEESVVSLRKVVG